MHEQRHARRILLTTDAVGGVWTYSLDLARELAQFGTETVLAVLGPPPRSSQGDAARAIPGLQLLATGLSLDWTAESPETLRETSIALGRLAADHQVETVQLHAPALAVARRFACPVVTLHHSCPATWWQAVRVTSRFPRTSPGGAISRRWIESERSGRGTDGRLRADGGGHLWTRGRTLGRSQWPLPVLHRTWRNAA